MIVLGKDYYIARFPGDRQLYSQFSIEILPYYQFSGSTVTLKPVLGGHTTI